VRGEVVFGLAGRYGRSVALLRVVFVIAGLALGLHGAHAFAAAGDDCLQRCDDDGPGGTCPPNCADCVCCAHQSPIVADTFCLAPPAIHDGQRFTVDADDAPASADPRELQHIPKSLLG
jgi:hypothetical protein